MDRIPRWHSVLKADGSREIACCLPKRAPLLHLMLHRRMRWLWRCSFGFCRWCWGRRGRGQGWTRSILARGQCSCRRNQRCLRQAAGVTLRVWLEQLTELS